MIAALDGTAGSWATGAVVDAGVDFNGARVPPCTTAGCTEAGADAVAGFADGLAAASAGGLETPEATDVPLPARGASPVRGAVARAGAGVGVG